MPKSEICRVYGIDEGVFVSLYYCSIGEKHMRETILFAEDEVMLAELVAHVLREEGYTVLLASDGMQALEVFHTHRESIDIVLTDLQMPRLGGWDALQAIHTVSPKLPAIVASGFIDEKLENEMLRKGVRLLISKPYLPNDILRKVREVLDSSQATVARVA